MKIADIPARLRRLNRSQADLARHLNDLDPSTLTKMIAGRRRVQAHEIALIEGYFGEKLEIEGVAAEAASFTPRRAPQRRVPVYGYAAAGPGDRVAYDEDQVLQWREPPPLWSGAGQLAYVRVPGEAMEPRYFAGELAPVLLGVDPGHGQDCMIEFANGTAAIRTFVRRKAEGLVVRQYNPAQDVQIALRDVRAVHAVWRPGLL